MTEQELEALTGRLTRIWQIDAGDLRWEMEPTHVWGLGDGYVFEGQITEGVEFRYWQDSNLLRISSSDLCTFIDNYQGDICEWYFDQHGAVRQSTPFTVQWKPFLRRNCWLSGCDIDATAHEKAE